MGLAYSTFSPEQEAYANPEDYAYLPVDSYINLQLDAAQIHTPGAAATNINILGAATASIHTPGAVAAGVEV